MCKLYFRLPKKIRYRIAGSLSVSESGAPPHSGYALETPPSAVVNPPCSETRSPQRGGMSGPCSPSQASCRAKPQTPCISINLVFCGCPKIDFDGTARKQQIRDSTSNFGPAYSSEIKKSFRRESISSTLYVSSLPHNGPHRFAAELKVLQHPALGKRGSPCRPDKLSLGSRVSRSRYLAKSRFAF